MTSRWRWRPRVDARPPGRYREAVHRLSPLALLVAACATPTAHAPTPLDAPVAERHDAAVARFQRTLDHEAGDLQWRCADLCAAADDACQSAETLCTSGGDAPSGADAARCTRARHGCGWTLTLMPRPCRACAPAPSGLAGPLEEHAP